MFSHLLESLLGTFSAHPYIILFIGLLFTGEAFLLPAVYLALSGKLHLSYIVGIAMISTAIADIFWYSVGSHIKNRFAKRLVTGRVQKGLEKLSGAFSKRSGLVLYLSKFVYGTRTAAQVLSGLQGMSFRRYFGINFLGIFSLLMFIIILAYSIDATVEGIGGIIHTLETGFLIFVVVLITVQFLFGRYIKKIWSR
jgi:membrane protein DedA with SNARE-associated domain